MESMKERFGWIFNRLMTGLNRVSTSLFAVNSDSSRQVEIDGIRGWAAITVLVWHARYCLYADYGPASRLYHLLGDGNLSVSLFYILSGDALSLTTTSSKGVRGVSPGVIIKRIPRLSGTLTIASVLIWFAYLIGICYHKTLLPLHHPGWPMGPDKIESYSFLDYIRFSWIHVFSGYDLDIDKNLHTMPTELRGSILVFAMCSALQHLRFRAVIVFATFLYTYSYFDTNMGLFVYGVFLGELRALGVFEFLHSRTYTRIIAAIAVLCIPLIRMPDTGPYLTWITGFDVGIVRFSWNNYPLYIIPIYYGSKDAVGFFSNRISKFFGDISFMLYAVHHHVISTLGCFILYRVAINKPSPIYYDDQTRDWTLIAVGAASLILATAAHKLEKLYLYWLDRGSKLAMASSPVAQRIIPSKAEYEPLSEANTVATPQSQMEDSDENTIPKHDGVVVNVSQRRKSITLLRP